MRLHQFIAVFQVLLSAKIINSLDIIETTIAPKHALPVDIDAEFGHTYNGNVNNSVEFQYWFTGSIDDATIVVQSLVKDDTTEDNRVRFQVRWEELEDQASPYWLLPFRDSNENRGRLYHEFNKTLCSDINQDNGAGIKVATIKVVVFTLSKLPVNFTLRVDFGKSNIISNFNETTSVDLALFSPAYFKLKLPVTIYDSQSQYALLEVWSDDDACVTVALQQPKCPVFDKQENVELDRHLTMSKNASVTIGMDHLLEGRFLVFVLHTNDSKCTSGGFWDNGIVPMSQQNGEMRRKKLFFTVREKITDNQYLFSTLLSAGFFLSVLVLFPIVYCTVKTVHRRRNQNTEFRLLTNEVHEGGGDENRRSTENLPGSSRESVHAVENNATQNADDDDNDEDRVYLCGILEKRFDNNRCQLTSRISMEAKKRSAQRYFGTLLVNAIFYILPAVQLLWIYQRVFRFTGNEDICYFNFRCLHPFFGVTAFNHWFSNIGYIILGGLFYLLVWFDRSSKALGIFKAMGIALMIQGVMSGLYHTCPNHISFQFDTCFMYVTAMLCCVTIYQAQHPDTTASAILTYTVVAVSVGLGVAAVVSKVWYFWILIMTVHVAICFLVSLHLDAKWGNYKWKFVWPCSRSFKEILCSLCRPFHLDSFSLEKIALIMFNFINLAAALVGHWIFQKSQDFASYLLFLFILNLSIFSVVHLVMKVKKRTVSWQTVTYLVLTIPTWSAALYFYFTVTASWGVSPAESRMLNKDCVLFHFFDNHDIWHFLSAFGMFLNFMFFYTLDEDMQPSCHQDHERNRNTRVKIYVTDDEEPLEVT